MLLENLFFVVPICVLGIPANGTNDADFFFQQQTLIMLWFLTTLSLWRRKAHRLFLVTCTVKRRKINFCESKLAFLQLSTNWCHVEVFNKNSSKDNLSLWRFQHVVHIRYRTASDKTKRRYREILLVSFFGYYIHGLIKLLVRAIKWKYKTPKKGTVLGKI